jgi:hypothetical protein
VEILMRVRVVSTSLLCLLAACGNEGAAEEKSTSAAQAKQTAYAECMAAANRQASRAESVVAARRCLHLPDAPPPGSTPPPGTPPPPAGAFADGDTGAINSVYTSLAEKDCRVMEVDEESASSVSRCPGVAGHALLVSDGDARMSVGVITPDGKAHELHYWTVITHAFSSLGPRAEWRMQGERPIALIVRVNAFEDPDNPERTTSYLAVAKLTPQEICVTDRIGPVPDANTAARAAADRSAGRTCVKEAPM